MRLGGRKSQSIGPDGVPEAPMEPLEHPKSQSIGPAGVWEAWKLRSIVPVRVWRPPVMLRSHDPLCLSVFGAPQGATSCFDPGQLS